MRTMSGAWAVLALPSPSLKLNDGENAVAKESSTSRRTPSPPARDPKDKHLWIYGVNPVTECLKADPGNIVEVRCSRQDLRAREVIEVAHAHGIPVSLVERRILSEQLGHDHHQGVAARLKAFHYESLETLLAQPDPHGLPILLLDCIQDPQNLGAILRTAGFLGTRAVVFPKDRSAPVTGAVFKAAAGALVHLQVVQTVNLVRALEQIKKVGYWIVGLDLQARQSLYDLRYTMPVALVVGNEATGLRPLVKRTCDFLVKIPGAGAVQSLNASVAAAVALAEIRRQQTAPRHLDPPSGPPSPP